MLFRVSLLAAALAVCAAPDALAQTARARASAAADLDARFAQAQADPALAQQLLASGRKAAAVCANCHGANGNSPSTLVPNLAGQNPAYLLEQVRQFADGRRRDMWMEGMVRALEADEKIGIVLFYSAQQVTVHPAADAALAARGQAYYGKVCFRCHGTDGRGNAQIARVAGQQAGYLSKTLTLYRDGKSPRADSIMQPNTRQMADADIAAVAAYVSTMP
ncbi:MAG: cytochrome C [Acidovorax sp. SCN 68-22]|nr:MAG: cytochrome C [Acidovorax sp. SCN 68-22]